jgi:hypothetical protein
MNSASLDLDTETEAGEDQTSEAGAEAGEDA